MSEADGKIRTHEQIGGMGAGVRDDGGLWGLERCPFGVRLRVRGMPIDLPPDAFEKLCDQVDKFPATASIPLPAGQMLSLCRYHDGGASVQCLDGESGQWEDMRGVSAEDCRLPADAWSEFVSVLVGLRESSTSPPEPVPSPDTSPEREWDCYAVLLVGLDGSIGEPMGDDSLDPGWAFSAVLATDTWPEHVELWVPSPHEGGEARRLRLSPKQFEHLCRHICLEAQSMWIPPDSDNGFLRPVVMTYVGPDTPTEHDGSWHFAVRAGAQPTIGTVNVCQLQSWRRMVQALVAIATTAKYNRDNGVALPVRVACDEEHMASIPMADGAPLGDARVDLEDITETFHSVTATDSWVAVYDFPGGRVRGVSVAAFGTNDKGEVHALIIGDNGRLYRAGGKMATDLHGSLRDVKHVEWWRTYSAGGEDRGA